MHFADAGYDCDGVCLNDADGDGVCDEFESPVADASACNYNADATDTTVHATSPMPATIATVFA